jgi:uncharacterized membrane protein
MAKEESPQGSQVYHVVAYGFEGQDRAGQVMDLIKSNAPSAGLQVKAWAVISVNSKGKVKVSETSKAGLGAGVGAGAGALLGLIGGPAGLLLMTLGGAALGGIAGRHMGNVIPEDQLKALGAAMKPNTSAILVLLEDTAAEKMNNALAPFAPSTVSITVGDQASGELVQAEYVDFSAAVEKAEADAKTKKEAAAAAADAAAATPAPEAKA